MEKKSWVRISIIILWLKNIQVLDNSEWWCFMVKKWSMALHICYCLRIGWLSTRTSTTCLIPLVLSKHGILHKSLESKAKHTLREKHEHNSQNPNHNLEFPLSKGTPSPFCQKGQFGSSLEGNLRGQIWE